MTAPLTDSLEFARHHLHRTSVQFGSGSSGLIIHGTTRSNACLVFMQSAKCGGIVLDGRTFKWPEIAIIPPASHFTFAFTGLTQWISWSILTELINSSFKKYLASTETNKTLITPQTAALIKLIDAATMARKVIESGEAKRLQSTETSLLELLDSIFAGSHTQRRCFDKRIEEIMSRVLECLRRDSQSHVSTLAHAAGVSERTLHRVFQKYLQMGPKRYAKIRQLNLVRTTIRQNHSRPVNITGILSEHGVTEFGRFSIEYKVLFNELPAETLHRHFVSRSKRIFQLSN